MWSWGVLAPLPCRAGRQPLRRLPGRAPLGAGAARASCYLASIPRGRRRTLVPGCSAPMGGVCQELRFHCSLRLANVASNAFRRFVVSVHTFRALLIAILRLSIPCARHSPSKKSWQGVVGMSLLLASCAQFLNMSLVSCSCARAVFCCSRLLSLTFLQSVVQLMLQPVASGLRHDSHSCKSQLGLDFL